MYKLTYSNTFKGPLDTDPEQTTTNSVMVRTELDGHELVAMWNRGSQRHCQGRYCYAVVAIAWATKAETEKLDLY